jgi:hypothetical protein
LIYFSKGFLPGEGSHSEGIEDEAKMPNLCQMGELVESGPEG